MKRILISLLSIVCLYVNAQVNKEIKPYIEFLENNAMVSAKDYVLSMFKDNDIVILCERHHEEITQYDLFLEIIQDPYFIENVGVLFTEVGSRILNPDLNLFLQNSNLTTEQIEKEVLNFQRQCMFAVWDKSNFAYFIRGIHTINAEIKHNKKSVCFQLMLYILKESLQKGRYMIC
ncbi:MAG: hypothetical protein LIO93_01005 [Bacteroidales bacterium]|nr:hypothetical protein [Bacteroidales bacterium]